MSPENPQTNQSGSFEKLFYDSLPSEESARKELLTFLNNCPPLPSNPRQAFLAVRDYFYSSGIRYDDTVFMPEDIIQNKKANCLGLAVMYGAILEQRGFSPTFQVVVNARDKRQEREIKDFGKLIRGEIFEYNNLPDLPVDKEEEPEYHFVPLEHPVLVIGGQKFETTSFPDDENSKPDEEFHDFASESQRFLTLRNLNGSLLISKAKTLFHKSSGLENIQPIIEFTKKGLSLWPEDRQGWLLLRDLALKIGNQDLAEEAEQKFKSLSAHDSLYYFSMYEIGEGENNLNKALEIYPAFIDAFVLKNVKLPYTTESEKKEAQFNLTVAAICVANSIELDLQQFYLRHIELYKAAFGEEYVAELLEDMEITKS